MAGSFFVVVVCLICLPVRLFAAVFSSRACRFKRCCEVGMECTELNVERRRKRKASDGKMAAPNASPPLTIDDPLICDLIAKEDCFLKMLTSSAAPIHASVADALKTSSTFDEVAIYERAQLAAGDQMSFSYWRAKILSTCVEWAKSFAEFQVCERDECAFCSHSTATAATRRVETTICAPFFFQQLELRDREALIVHTSFSNLVLSEAFHTRACGSCQ